MFFSLQFKASRIVDGKVKEHKINDKNNGKRLLWVNRKSVCKIITKTRTFSLNICKNFESNKK